MSGEPLFSIDFTARYLATDGPCSVGDALVYDGALGYWRVSTAAHRTSADARTQAIALTAYGASVVGTVSYQASGIIAREVSGLTATTAGLYQLVRVSAAGRLERVASYSAGDDIVGYAMPDGRVALHIGIPWETIAALVSTITGRKVVYGDGLLAGAAHVTISADGNIEIAKDRAGGVPAEGDVRLAKAHWATGRATDNDRNLIVWAHSFGIEQGANQKNRLLIGGAGPTGDPPDAPYDHDTIEAYTRKGFYLACSNPTDQTRKAFIQGFSDNLYYPGINAVGVTVGPNLAVNSPSFFTVDPFRGAKGIFFLTDRVTAASGAPVGGLDLWSRASDHHPMATTPDGVDHDLLAGVLVVAGDGIRVATAGSTATISGVAKSCSPETFGAVGDDTADDTTALQNSLNAIAAGTYSHLELGARTYKITSGLNWTAATKLCIRGQGLASAIHATNGVTTAVLSLSDASHLDLSSFRIFGDAAWNTNGAVTAAGGGSSQNGIEVVGTSNLRLCDLTVHNLGGPGISFAVGPELSGGEINACRVYQCAYGLYASDACTVTNFQTFRCGTGVVIGAGNVSFVGGDIVNCATGVDVLVGGNAAHGIFSGTIIRHNITALHIAAITNGHLFSGCTFYEGAMTFDGGNDCIVFSNCLIDLTSYTLAGKSLFIGCRFDTAYLSSASTTGGQNRFVFSRNIDDSIPTWIQQILRVSYTFPSDANQTLGAQTSCAEVLAVQAGMITTSRTITNALAPDRGNRQTVKNLTSYSLSYKWATGTAVTIPAGLSAIVGADGTNAAFEILESVGGSSAISFTATTTDNTTQTLYSWSIVDNATTRATAKLQGIVEGSAYSGDWIRRTRYLSQSGAVSQGAVQDVFTDADAIGISVTLDASGATGRLRANGASALTTYFAGSIALDVLSGGAPPVIDPTTFAFGGLFRGSYAGSPWAGIASAGTSGGHSVSTLGAAPSTGTAQNGFTPATFNGSTQALGDAVNLLSAYMTPTAYRVLILFKASSASAPAAQTYDDPALLSESSGDFGVTFNTNGVGIYHAAVLVVTKACPADGNYHVADIKFDGTTVSISIDGGTPATGASSTTDTIDGEPQIGTNYAAAVHFAGSILDLEIAPTTLSSLTTAQWIAYVNARYALSI